MKAFKYSLMIAGLLAVGTNAFAGNWPPKGSELEKACLSWGNTVLSQQPIDTQVAESYTVIKAALTFTDDEAQKAIASAKSIFEKDPSKKVQHVKMAGWICETQLTEQDIQSLKNGLLNPQSVTESSDAK